MRVRSDLALRWSGALPLTWRILAVNLLAVALMAGAFFYLDSYRSRLVGARLNELVVDSALLTDSLALARRDAQQPLALRFALTKRVRVRVYDPAGTRIFDSFEAAQPTYALRDPREQPWYRQVARAMDRGIDWIVGAPARPTFREPGQDTLSAWPELRQIRQHGGPASQRYRNAPDLTPVFSVARRGQWSTPDTGAPRPAYFLITSNARDVTTRVRAERLRLGIALAVVVLLSILLSLFLARTIVRPLQRLASAATRVRLGRAREVVVPRLPSRRDEIGQLARALSDMTQTLRDRIDASDRFAADVTHELKNPLASLRSALETLERVEDVQLRQRLVGIAAEDVQRLDRLVTDIAEAARVGPQLSRARYQLIDMGELLEEILASWRQRASANGQAIAFARPRRESTRVWGDKSQLARVIENLIDNALSFSPPGGVVTVTATCAGHQVAVRVEDNGPGIAEEQREAIFRRFHTHRNHDQQGNNWHSGLGLAISHAIVDAHDGSIRARARLDGDQGACLEILLPSADPC